MGKRRLENYRWRERLGTYNGRYHAWHGICSDRTAFAGRAVDELIVDFAGVVGDRHYGGTRPASSFEPWHKRAAPIRNGRQLTIVSSDELAEVAAAMGVAEIRPEWIAANLAMSGVPRLTMLPAGTRLIIDDGPVLLIEGENDPCRMAGRSIGEHYADKSDLDLLFPIHAQHQLGVIASVESPVTIEVGAMVQVRIPAQRLYRV